MMKDKLINGLIKFLIIQLVFFSLSNMIIIITGTYERLSGNEQVSIVKYLNLKVMLIPIMIMSVIICLSIFICRIKKIDIKIKKIDIKVFFLIGIPFLISAIIVFTSNMYLGIGHGFNSKLMRINEYTIILLIIFTMITVTLIYTIIKVIRNKVLLVSKIGLKLIFVIGIAFVVSMLLLNTISKFIESYLLDYGDIDPKKFVGIYNTISLGFIIVVLVTFILIILAAVNKRVEYLNYMAVKLRNISDIQYADDLEIKGNDELSELANSINIMSKKLKNNYESQKKIEKEKNDLIVSVSHDLRTPLTSIIGYLDLLKDEKLKDEKLKDEEIRKEYLEIAYGKSKDLKKLIEELFEYTKVSNNYISLKKEKFNLAILINQILGTEALFFSEKNINIEFESESNEIYCEIDLEKMVRIIGNIVKNAQRYSFPNTTFKVCVMEKDNDVLISFENIGEHIEKEELNLIFEKLYRLDKSRSTVKEGTGLGLAIAKKLVELHDGMLWAECEGNTIRFIMLLHKD